VTKIFDDMGKENGLVVVFDDMARLQQAERAAAWREVAKKMAHEVKNPLTPIQLSAQRLQKRLREKMNDPDDARLLEECTNTIVEHVSVLKKLVNAFSEYAKLPATEVAPHDMNAIISEPVKLFREAHKNIIFAMERDLALPDNISVDAEKINRVVVNLLNNAVASLEGRDDGAIVIKMFGNALSNSLRVEVQDNGCGVPAQNKSSVFDPYFSTKATGTGLGLAIVRSIISDHGGSVGIKDNAGGGTIVFFEIPLPTA
ncbi:MAG: PAS domain-containing sensor histidine kinase, partial [Deltaproteobacteria bacterium]|nr:PAS domain-containing sensor histidine kinase [Deltaproteobacteria bacterium]